MFDSLRHLLFFFFYQSEVVEQNSNTDAGWLIFIHPVFFCFNNFFSLKVIYLETSYFTRLCYRLIKLSFLFFYYLEKNTPERKVHFEEFSPVSFESSKINFCILESSAFKRRSVLSEVFFNPSH